MNLEKDKKLTLEELFYKQKEIRQYIYGIEPKSEEYKKLSCYLAEIITEYRILQTDIVNEAVQKAEKIKFTN